MICMVWFFYLSEGEKGMLLHGTIYTTGGSGQRLYLE